jgi:hypothetical protein
MGSMAGYFRIKRTSTKTFCRNRLFSKIMVLMAFYRNLVNSMSAGGTFPSISSSVDFLKQGSGTMSRRNATDQFKASSLSTRTSFTVIRTLRRSSFRDVALPYNVNLGQGNTQFSPAEPIRTTRTMSASDSDFAHQIPMFSAGRKKSRDIQLSHLRKSDESDLESESDDTDSESDDSDSESDDLDFIEHADSNSTWTVDTEYNPGDLVFFDGEWYVCTASHESRKSSKPSSKEGFWIEFSGSDEGEEDDGSGNKGNGHAYGRYVHYLGKWYSCHQNRSQQPAWTPAFLSKRCTEVSIQQTTFSGTSTSSMPAILVASSTVPRWTTTSQSTINTTVPPSTNPNMYKGVSSSIVPVPSSTTASRQDALSALLTSSQTSKTNFFTTEASTPPRVRSWKFNLT